MKKIKLKKGKEISLDRRHRWIFSGALQLNDLNIADGDWVEVTDFAGNTHAFGHYALGSIAVRILHFGNELPQLFYANALTAALNMRNMALIANQDHTNCYRLIHGEGDGLPGLIIDIYHKVAVIQCHSVGMLHDITNIAMAIKEVFDKNIEAVYSKSAEAMHQTGVAGGAQNGFIVGKCDTSFQILENGHKFTIDLVKGQKTGFFLDQRENRKLLSLYSKGKKVLNTFSYTGGFSIYAKAAGAQEVVSVDVSATAMHMATENFKLNQLQYNDTDFVIEDCQKYLQGDISRFDVVILDPPAYAKNIKKRHNAVMGYKRLNALAMRNMKPGSILLTFSCSQVVDKLLFQSTIQAAAIEARKNVKILHYLHQPSDHPVDVCHPESEYLKGLMVYVF